MTIRYDGSSVSVDEAQLHCRRVKASTPIVPNNALIKCLPRYIWYNVCSALMPIVIFNLCVYWKHCQIPMRQEIISSEWKVMSESLTQTHTYTRHTADGHGQWGQNTRKNEIFDEIKWRFRDGKQTIKVNLTQSIRLKKLYFPPICHIQFAMLQNKAN